MAQDSDKVITISAVENEAIHIISAKILTEAYKKLGYKVDFNFLPAKRSLAWANNGTTDREMARIRGIEQKYPNLIPVPTSIINLNSAAFTKSIPNSTKIEIWSDKKI